MDITVSKGTISCNSFCKNIIGYKLWMLMGHRSTRSPGAHQSLNISPETTAQALASVRDPNVRSVHGGRFGAHSGHGCECPETRPSVKRRDSRNCWLIKSIPGSHRWTRAFVPGTVLPSFVTVLVQNLPDSVGIKPSRTWSNSLPTEGHALSPPPPPWSFKPCRTP